MTGKDYEKFVQIIDSSTTLPEVSPSRSTKEIPLHLGNKAKSEMTQPLQMK